ncbi:hypothetical protein A2U01_0114397, partial [Trifolium medium]|nr:hypothetical protein [Trifolium medium]
RRDFERRLVEERKRLTAREEAIERKRLRLIECGGRLFRSRRDVCVEGKVGRVGWYLKE